MPAARLALAKPAAFPHPQWIDHRVPEPPSMKRLLAFAALLAFASPVLAQGGFTPEEAVTRMKLPDGFSVRCVAAEPMIRQPVSISFDARGRLWVLQYLQYPNYAGLKPLKQDQYLRTIWDRVPEPPPHGPKGADRLTICYDPDENGVFRKSKDFVSGLNIASGFCLGNGGVYIVQPPYLLFYPDKDEDDIPDGDPEVLLTGFGMDDTHSLANSLQWGPDGWLYGAAGSTSTCKILNPADPKAPPVEFQQGIWRYHPKTKRFELFSEGGGNTYGLDFDKHGQVIAGTNWGGFACLHQMQGAYYVKGFSKHGPLHNQHTYGYFDHVPYAGFKGGHVTCGGIVYQADAYPPEYRDQYIAGNLLSNAVYWHKLEPLKSSFKAGHGGDLVIANDSWFRPVDLTLGPDGCVYIADWYDKRAAHLDPVDNWDKTNGRVYKIEYKGTPKIGPIDVRQKTSAELVELLKHPNKWWRNEARRLLAERQDKSVHEKLRQWVKWDHGLLALEALWALHVSGGWDDFQPEELRWHPNEYVRAWAIRLAADSRLDRPRRWFVEEATDGSQVVLAQLACSARRMHVEDARSVVVRMMQNPACTDDPHLSLLIWWAIEDHLTRSAGKEINWLSFPGGPAPPLLLQMSERYARRMMAGDFESGSLVTSRVLGLLVENDRPAALRGIAKALEGRTMKFVPDALLDALGQYEAAHPDDPLILEILLRMNVPSAFVALRKKAVDASAPESERMKAVQLLGQVRDPKAKELFLTQLATVKSDAAKVGLLSGLEAFDDPFLADAVFAQYPKWSPAVKKRAVQFLLSRPAWALALLQRFDSGAFPKADLTLDHAKAAIALNDARVTALVEKHFGKLAPATAGEKQARIAWLSRELQVGGRGDVVKGKALFTKHCAACHQLHGEGGKVGPDLTTADRKNRTYILTQIVDPSGYIRPEYVVHNVTTTDGRKLTGIVAESSAESVTLLNVVNDQPQRTVVAKADIEDMKPSAVSLMPEKLLDTLSYPEIVDLFAYLASDAPGAGTAPGAGAAGAPKNDAPATKKLKVCLVSGSFEYKSDESLAAFQKYLEANFPVECTRVFAKAEKDKDLSGLENLEKCDVAIFFTRRLQLDGESLDRVKAFVKSGKPIVGIRTASHGFQNWLLMDKEVFGGDYKGHFGQTIECEVKVEPKAKDHPALRGVGEFKTTGGLYKNPDVAHDVTVLLRGTITQGTEPVAWVREKDGRRVFYTSLGTPDDFKDPNFTRLLVNGLAWVTKSEWKPAK
jgi:putative membrane-bound dehydrogenase-like protein